MNLEVTNTEINFDLMFCTKDCKEATKTEDLCSCCYLEWLEFQREV